MFGGTLGLVVRDFSVKRYDSYIHNILYGIYINIYLIIWSSFSQSLFALFGVLQLLSLLFLLQFYLILVVSLSLFLSLPLSLSGFIESIRIGITK